MANPGTTLAPPRLQLVDKDNPFQDDLFERKDYAKQLTGYLDLLRNGAVLAIDAPWGEGKSWFGRNWAADLESQDYRVIYLDAFQQDYVEDPFLLIASEITETLASGDTTRQVLNKNAASVMKAIAPVGMKVLLSLAGRIALGSADLPKVVTEAMQEAGENATDATQQWLENKIEEHSQDKASLENFKETLKAFCGEQPKPVVFFVDELDRCRPTFAVRLIERIKHFFDVPNLIFVLLLNRDQLENAVKGVYGQETDAATYLGKFVHLFFRLPKKTEMGCNHTNANYTYLCKIFEHYKLENTRYLEVFIDEFSLFSVAMGMSLRDMEKGMALLALSGVHESAVYLSWLIALKLKHPCIFNGLLRQDVEADKKSLEILAKIHVPHDIHFWAKKYFRAYHRKKVFGHESLTDDEKKTLTGENLGLRMYASNDPMPFLLKQINIAI